MDDHKPRLMALDTALPTYFAMEVVLPPKGVSPEARALRVRTVSDAGRLVLDGGHSLAWGDLHADPAQAGPPACP